MHLALVSTHTHTHTLISLQESSTVEEVDLTQRSRRSATPWASAASLSSSTNSVATSWSTVCPTYSLLGVTISEDLKWEKHVAKTTQKANWVLSLLRGNLHFQFSCMIAAIGIISTSNFFPADIKQTAYTALVRSLLEYGATSWDPYLHKDINRLKNVQRKQFRRLLHHRKLRGWGLQLVELHLPNLKERRKNLKLTLFFKVVGGWCQLSQFKICAKQFENCNTSYIIDRQMTNNSKCYNPIRAQTESYRSSYFPSIIIEWNHLDDNTINSTSTSTFRKAIDKAF